jgi:O-antigen ligase/tetratricopeptide (TPR) repeat protein
LQVKDKNALSSLFFLYIFLLFFAPLAFASVELWSITTVELGVAILGLLLFFYQLKGQIPAVIVPGAVPLFLLLLYMVFQLVPLPPWLIEILSPGSTAAYQPVYQAVGENSWTPLSVHPKATVSELLRIASYGLFYVITIQLLADGKRLMATVKIVAGLAACIAFLAILQRYTSPDHIYWFRPGPSHSPRFMGPWIHRGQFAGFMTMLLPLLYGLFLYYKPTIDKTESLRAKIVDFFASPRSNLQLILVFGIVIILFSVLVSLSRAGIIVAILSILLFYYFLSKKRGILSWPILVVFLAGIGLFFVNFGSDEWVSRIDSSITADGELIFDRLETWRDTAEIIKVFWLTGAGFGTFVDIFPLYKSIANQYVYDHAHNDYLELLTDGGIIGFALAAWFVLAVVGNGWKMIALRRDNFSILIGIGALVGICSMLLFAITDFNMHNGADGLYFFFLCGLLVSCGHTRFQYRSSATLLGMMPAKSRIVLRVSTLLFLAGVLIFPLRSFIAQQMYGSVSDVYLSRQLAESKMEELAVRLKKISSYDPLEGAYQMVLGNIEKYRGSAETALHYYLQAALKNPLRGEFLQQVALVLPPDRISLADRLMEHSYQRSFQKDTLMLNYAEWLIWRGDTGGAGVVLRQGLADKPSLPDDALMLLTTHFRPDEIATILPDRVEPWISIGKFYDSAGLYEDSEFFRKRALEFEHYEEEPRSSWYSQLYSFYIKQDREEEAVAVLRQAVEKFPENVAFHLHLGDYYKKQGILYRAKEEYERALLFEPDNTTIRQRLEGL